MKKIFLNGYLVTMDQQRRVIEDGAVVVSEDRIIDIGESTVIYDKYGAQAEIIDCAHKMILPGLIDCHAHAGHSLFTMLGYASLSHWMPMMTELYHHNTTEEFWHIEGQLAALSRLKYGVTCGVSVLSNCQRSDNPQIGILHSNAYAEVGVREVVAVGPCNPPYPRQFTYIEKDEKKRQKSFSFDQLMRGAEDTISAVHHSHNDLIRAFIAPFVLVTSVNGSSMTAPDIAVALTDHDRYMMKCVREVAKNKKTRIHTEAFGGMIRLVKDDPYALLGPDVHLQHCTGISFDEAKLLVDSQTHVSSTPSARQLMHRCPIIELMEMGGNVVISTDASAPAATYDLVQMARTTKLVHQAALHDYYYFPAGKLLEMITIDAAKALGWQDEIGSLEIGKKADIITVNLDAPHLTPRYMPIHKWLFLGSGRDVDNAMVNGQMVLRDSIPVKVAQTSILEKAHIESLKTIKRAGMQKLLSPCDTFWGSSRIYIKEKRF